MRHHTRQLISLTCPRDSLSEAQRLDYVRAVQCLHAKEPKQPGGLAHNRLEEFIIPHVNQTLEIHASVRTCQGIQQLASQAYRKRDYSSHGTVTSFIFMRRLYEKNVVIKATCPIGTGPSTSRIRKSRQYLMDQPRHFQAMARPFPTENTACLFPAARLLCNSSRELPVKAAVASQGHLRTSPCTLMLATRAQLRLPSLHRTRVA